MLFICLLFQDGRTLDAVDLDKSIHARPEEVIADGDCFDDLDGRHGMHENDSARERRLRGESGFIDQLTSFETRSVFYSSLFIFEWLIFLFFPPLSDQYPASHFQQNFASLHCLQCAGQGSHFMASESKNSPLGHSHRGLIMKFIPAVMVVPFGHWST